MIGFAALLSTILVVAATKPKTFRIQRSTSIDAPPESVFVLIDDLHTWARWAPQDKEDASMKRTYNGPEHGAGAVSEWTGSGGSGKGHMLITDSLPSTRISIQVDWVKPFVARNLNDFVLEGTGTSTKGHLDHAGPESFCHADHGCFCEHGPHHGETLRNWSCQSKSGGRTRKSAVTGQVFSLLTAG
jgi:uncharacterized protein YndB with AHSA1/START domain